MQSAFTDQGDAINWYGGAFPLSGVLIAKEGQLLTSCGLSIFHGQWLPSLCRLRMGRAGSLLHPCSVATFGYTIDRWEVCGSTTYLFSHGEVSFWHYARHTSLLAVWAPWAPRPPEIVGAMIPTVLGAGFHLCPSR